MSGHAVRTGTRAVAISNYRLVSFAEGNSFSIAGHGWGMKMALSNSNPSCGLKICGQFLANPENLHDDGCVRNDVRRNRVVGPQVDPGVARPQREIRLDQARTEKRGDDKNDGKSRMRQ